MVAWLHARRAWADVLVAAVLAAALVLITNLGFRDQGLDPIGDVCCALAGLAFASSSRS